jgi:hypothetical protein
MLRKFVFCGKNEQERGRSSGRGSERGRGRGGGGKGGSSSQAKREGDSEFLFQRTEAMALKFFDSLLKDFYSSILANATESFTPQFHSDGSINAQDMAAVATSSPDSLFVKVVEDFSGEVEVWRRDGSKGGEGVPFLISYDKEYDLFSRLRHAAGVNAKVFEASRVNRICQLLRPKSEAISESDTPIAKVSKSSEKEEDESEEIPLPSPTPSATNTSSSFSSSSSSISPAPTPKINAVLRDSLISQVLDIVPDLGSGLCGVDERMSLGVCVRVRR